MFLIFDIQSFDSNSEDPSTCVDDHQMCLDTLVNRATELEIGSQGVRANLILQ